MGSIRTFLALSVVFSHCFGFVFVGGPLAVQLFYVISGFLISFVLVEAKTYKRTSTFYLNRALRLFPIYYVVAFSSLIIFVGIHFATLDTFSFWQVYGLIDFPGTISLFLSNLFLFGQDWIMFTGVREGAFQLVSDFRVTEINVWQGLLVPQAWTLGVELTFYLFAPFILKDKRVMLVALLVSLTLRCVLIGWGVGLSDPWSYRFFPTELALFLVGAFSHQIWMPWLARIGVLTKSSAFLVTLIFLAICAAYCLMPHTPFNAPALILILGLMLPFLFYFQKGYKWDRMIGELSYPIYISHMGIIYLLGVFFGQVDLLEEKYWTLDRALIVLVLTVVVSISLNHFVANPFERWRIRVKAR